MKKTVLKDKKCKWCKLTYTPKMPLQQMCSMLCAINYTNEQKKKKANKEHKEAKEGLLTHKDYIQLLQKVFNTFIRLRDKELSCISCGRTNVEEFHAGHYVNSTYQYHRFNENNVNKQCSYCNTHLRGNLIDYRKGLIAKIGLEEVEYLENSKRMMLEITIPEIKELIIEYKKKIKELK
jgi:hypothetical protein